MHPPNYFEDKERLSKILLSKRIIKSSPDGRFRDCWYWTGTTNDGYGRIIMCDYRKHPIKIHRLSAYLWLNYDIENSKLCVLHKCDNRLCFNPEHLWFGTCTDNMEDKNNKGRQARGEKVNTNILSSDDVLAVRIMFEEKIETNKAEIARIYKVSVGCIKGILSKKTWRHI